MFCEVRVTKPAQAPKQKKLKFPGTMGPLLSSCWNCCFFLFFWCLSMFGASSGLVFFVFLVPVNVLWSQSHQTCTVTKKNKKNKPLDAPNLHRHQKKQKKQTTRCTKPAQAPKKTKKLKFPGTMGPLLSSCWNFCFFVFFGACRCLVHLVVWTFLVFLVPVNVLWSQSHQTCTGTKKTQKNKPLDAPNLHRHQKKQKN